MSKILLLKFNSLSYIYIVLINLLDSGFTEIVRSSKINCECYIRIYEETFLIKIVPLPWMFCEKLQILSMLYKLAAPKV